MSEPVDPRAVACPGCGAAIAEPCRSMWGNKLLSHHVARIRAAREARMAADAEELAGG